MQVVLSFWYNIKPDTLSTAKAHPNVSATFQSTSSQPIYLRSTLTSLSFIYPHLPSGCQKVSPYSAHPSYMSRPPQFLRFKGQVVQCLTLEMEPTGYSKMSVNSSKVSQSFIIKSWRLTRKLLITYTSCISYSTNSVHLKLGQDHGTP
jgi:hypothetical protein